MILSALQVWTDSPPSLAAALRLMIRGDTAVEKQLGAECDFVVASGTRTLLITAPSKYDVETWVAAIREQVRLAVRAGWHTAANEDATLDKDEDL